jgi:hypothetical protein
MVSTPETGGVSTKDLVASLGLLSVNNQSDYVNLL